MSRHVLPIQIEGESGRVATELERRIVSGEARSGSLLNQSKIAAELGVSRVTVRDALQALASTGLVVLNGRAGASVAPMSIADLEEIFELRFNLEPLAARLGTPNLHRSDLVRMERAMVAMEEAPSDVEWVTHNATFHTIIYKRARRPRLVALVRTLRVLMDRYFAHALNASIRNPAAAAEHRAILEGARRGDAALAARLTADHIAGSHDILVRMLLEQADNADMELI